MILDTFSLGRSAYVFSRVRAALYAGKTTTIRAFESISTRDRNRFYRDPCAVGTNARYVPVPQPGVLTAAIADGLSHIDWKQEAGRQGEQADNSICTPGRTRLLQPPEIMEVEFVLGVEVLYRLRHLKTENPLTPTGFFAQQNEHQYGP